MIDKIVSSKILDDAREKIAEIGLEHRRIVNALSRDEGMSLVERRENIVIEKEHFADQILALSGTTDIECDDECHIGEATYPDCRTCHGTGVIKHKWEMGVHLKNGELPKSIYEAEGVGYMNECAVSSLRGYRDAREDMLNKKYRQVVTMTS